MYTFNLQREKEREIKAYAIGQYGRKSIKKIRNVIR